MAPDTPSTSAVAHLPHEVARKNVHPAIFPPIQTLRSTSPPHNSPHPPSCRFPSPACQYISPIPHPVMTAARNPARDLRLANGMLVSGR